MKKFIIAICGVMLACGAMGAPEHYKVPKQIFYSPDVWKAYNNGKAYTNNLDSTLYTNLASQMSKVSTNVHGTNEDEGAIVLIMARDISNNGGEFCMTQIQAANTDGRRYTWIDYYDYPNKYECEPLCRPGYYGSGCSWVSVPDACDTHKLYFGKYEKKTSGGWENQITKNIKVFEATNAEASSDKNATHRILAVTKKMDHGVIVSPVEIIGERYKDSGKWRSYIKSVQSNGQEFLLCAKGYKANDAKDDCVCPESLSPTDTYNYCNDVNNPSNYINDEKYMPVLDDMEQCYRFECNKDNGYAKDPSNNDCKKCERKFNQGINSSGECEQCEEPNEMFTND